MKILILTLALVATSSSFAFERTIDYNLDGTNCESFARDLNSLTGYNELTDISVDMTSCTDTSEWIFSKSIEAKLILNFKTCDTDTYTIKSYKQPGQGFLDGEGLRHFFNAIGVRRLGYASGHRGLYGIPYCE